MESIFAIGVGLVLRVVVDITTDDDERISGVVIGLWEGVVLNHFVRRQPRSFDPYIGVAFRIFVDFLFTQSLSRFALVALWAVLGMLLADVTPYVWRDSGLRRLWRHVRRDVRHVKRSVPRIRIKNDLPSVNLFKHSRSSSPVTSGSVRSDRATPSSSPARPPAPGPGPSRRPGRSPPGTFPGVSGWSEIGSDISDARNRVITNPGPSPAIIPSRAHAEIPETGRIDATQVVTLETRTTTRRDTTITVKQTEKVQAHVDVATVAVAASATVAAAAYIKPAEPIKPTESTEPVEPVDDPSRHDPPVIPDDWITVTQPTPVPEPLPEPNGQLTPKSEPAPGPSTTSPPRPASVLGPPPVLDVLPDIPDIDFDRASRPPEQVPLPESRAASVIGGVFDQPQPRSALRENALGLVDKATSELGVAPSKNSFASFISSQFSSITSHTRTMSTSSKPKSKLQNTVDIEAPEAPPKEMARLEAVVGRKTESVSGKSNVGDAAAQGPEPQLPTPAQVDPPPNALTQPAGPTPPSKAPPPESTSAPAPPPKKPEQPQLQPLTSEPDPLHADSGNADVNSTSQSGVEKGDTAAPSKKNSLFDVPTPNRSPPPPFSEFAGVPDGPAAGEAPAEEDPVTQDQDDTPTELTAEQKAAEEKRHAFLLTQLKDLQDGRDRFQRMLLGEDNLGSRKSRDIKQDLDDAEKSLSAIKIRMAKTKFSAPPEDPQVAEISLVNKSVTEVQYTLTSAIMSMILTREDAGPMTVQVMISKLKNLKGKPKEAKDALTALAKLHKFTTQSETATPGIVNITF